MDPCFFPSTFGHPFANQRMSPFDEMERLMMMDRPHMMFGLSPFGYSPSYYQPHFSPFFTPQHFFHPFSEPQSYPRAVQPPQQQSQQQQQQQQPDQQQQQQPVVEPQASTSPDTSTKKANWQQVSRTWTRVHDGNTNNTVERRCVRVRDHEGKDQMLEERVVNGMAARRRIDLGKSSTGQQQAQVGDQPQQQQQSNDQTIAPQQGGHGQRWQWCEWDNDFERIWNDNLLVKSVLSHAADEHQQAAEVQQQQDQQPQQEPAQQQQ
eukprot:c9091_g1_i1.p1 GENE.c9091_g1_i1~~c9091_g1_i1.p1  ORF type:complete len:264 (-),score=75.48 c9091_g1_i1:45-836(-)